jgi:cation diffusion facilitator family transporter
VVLADIGGGVGVAATKFLAALVTGSSAMLAEAVHSVVDTSNGLLLLLGIRRSQRPPDEIHPFGHGLEMYFWSFIVAILIFGLGAGAAIYQGVRHIIDPAVPDEPGWNYAVLACAAALEAWPFAMALRRFQEAGGRRGIWQAIHASKDPTVFTVLLENSAALAGLALAFLGVLLSQLLGAPWLDGAASVLIGVLLAIVGAVLARESRSLLVGESIDPDKLRRICDLAQADPAVVRVRRPLSLQLGPDQVLLTVDVQFKPGLTARQIEEAVDRMEKNIRGMYPEIRYIFLEAESIAAPAAPAPGQA